MGALRRLPAGLALGALLLGLGCSDPPTEEAPVVPEQPSVAPVPSPETRALAEEAPPPAEELALAMEIESDTDLEVIEMLDLLESLGEIESS